jgi:UDP-GlcNAc:undecaprenyl-phosphate GlcNAc-1-phosphate transferase
MSDAWRIAVAGAFTFAIVAALVPLCRRIALWRGITDHPAAGKWHRSPTPYLGGVAIAVGAIVCTLALPGWELEAATIALAACAVSITGLVDDIRNVSPSARLLVETVAALAAVAAGARVQLFGDVPDVVISVIWLIVITNAFNLLDNMDGAVGSIGTTVAVALAATALLQHQVLVGGLAVVVASACLAFLLYNWPPARIFMGDAGSLFIGFLLAVIALKLRTDQPHFASVVALLLLVAPAVFDTTLVVISRTRAGQPIYIGGTDHTSHRLRLLGLGPASTTVVLVVATGLSGAAGIAVAEGALGAAVAAIGVGFLALLALLALLRVPVYDRADSGRNAAATSERAPGAPSAISLQRMSTDDGDILAAFAEIWRGRVLDVGCRSQELARALTERSDIFYVGTGVASCGQVVADLNTGLPFGSDSADIVVCLDVFESAADLGRGFAELCRIARRYVVVSLPKRLDQTPSRHPVKGWPAVGPVADHLRFLSSDRARTFCRDHAAVNGFELADERSLVETRDPATGGPGALHASPRYVALLQPTFGVRGRPGTDPGQHPT